MLRKMIVSAVIGAAVFAFAPTASAQFAPVARKVFTELAEQGARKGGKEALEGAAEAGGRKAAREVAEESIETGSRRAGKEATEEGAERATRGLTKVHETPGRAGNSAASSRWKDFALVAGGAGGAGYLAGTASPTQKNSDDSEKQHDGFLTGVFKSLGVQGNIATMLAAVLAPILIIMFSILAATMLWSPCLALCRRVGGWLADRITASHQGSRA